MSLRAAWQYLYPPPSSGSPEVDSHHMAGQTRRGSDGADGELALMKEYEDFVAEQFRVQRTVGGPGKAFQNRNKDHAKVVIPYIFKGADKWVHLLARNVDTEVYGSEGVVEAAKRFLNTHPDGQISFLSEVNFERKEHPFFQAIDRDPGHAGRVFLQFVPEATQVDYGFNFALNDRNDYRFEGSRDTQQARVQFGGAEFASELEFTFQDLSSDTIA